MNIFTIQGTPFIAGFIKVSTKTIFKKGKCAALFLILYGILRIFSELFREPDLQVGYFYNFITMGSLLSFLMFISGLMMYIKIK